MRVPTTGSPFTERDVAQLEARGIGLAEAQRQLDRLRGPAPTMAIERPCTLGDGIESLARPDDPELTDAYAEAVAAGAVGAFVPASGAASRMFRDLIAWRRDPAPPARAALEDASRRGDAPAAFLLEFLDGLDRFAFRHEVAAALAARGETFALGPDAPIPPLLAVMLDADGLGYAARPKGLIPFHDTPDGPRTAFDEHLAEAAELYRDAGGRVRLQATVPAEYHDRFLHAVHRANRPDRKPRLLQFEVALSDQHHSTDTLAVDETGTPLRDRDGGLVLRPAGHGALLRNLAGHPAPVAMIKNVDNVVGEGHREPTRVWGRGLIGRLWGLRRRVHALLRRLDDASDDAAVVEAMRLAHEAFGHASEGRLDAPGARALLDRPLRVCGMVPNTGEPGGGPFWVRGRDRGVTPQIVEQAQVGADPASRSILARSTHFNPVFMACALDDARGRRYDLERFVDPEAVIVTRRSADGRDVVCLERPGLWNGAMAGWNTVFIEVPITVFNPVKTVNDLLRPQHQPG